MSLLEIKDFAVHYGGVKAVKNVNLHVDSGELVCLIGANGAGKTTTLKAICGLVPAAQGTVMFDGAPIAGMATHDIARRGLALVPEGRGIFSRMTVLENLEMGAYARTDRPGIQADLSKVLELFPRLAERRLQKAGTLSGGEQQMLAMGRALMSRPKLLLLDEPSMGLAPILVEKIFETIRNVAAEGVVVLLIEQNAKRALEISQRGYVMESGSITLAGPSSDLLNDPMVRKSYLGA